MFAVFSYPFFQHALLGALLTSALCAIIGSYVVTRRLVIAGGGMAHASLGGVGIGAYWGFSPVLGAAIFAVISGLGIHFLGRNSQEREDSLVAMIWTLGMAIGILFAFLAPGFMTDLSAFLFGNILTITRRDLYVISLLLLVVLVLFVLCQRQIITLIYDREFAQTQGIPVAQYEVLLTILTALTIVGSLRMVGIVMVVALLSVPQLTASLFVRSFSAMVGLSFVLALLGNVSGLLLSYQFNVPSGATVIVVSVLFYLVARIIKICILRHQRQKKDYFT